MQAREDYARRKIPFEYINVLGGKDDLDRMLRYSKGRREVPAIVEGGEVSFGYGGGS